VVGKQDRAVGSAHAGRVEHVLHGQPDAPSHQIASRKEDAHFAKLAATCLLPQLEHDVERRLGRAAEAGIARWWKSIDATTGRGSAQPRSLLHRVGRAVVVGRRGAPAHHLQPPCLQLPAYCVRAREWVLYIIKTTSDPNDEHVCALAITAAPATLITLDDDFNAVALAAHRVRVATPDDVLVPSFDEQPDALIAILERQARAWANRPVAELIDALTRAGAPIFAERARSAADL